MAEIDGIVARHFQSPTHGSERSDFSIGLTHKGVKQTRKNGLNFLFTQHLEVSLPFTYH